MGVAEQSAKERWSLIDYGIRWVVACQDGLKLLQVGRTCCQCSFAYGSSRSSALDRLGAAGMVAGLEKFSGNRLRQRASSPKLCVYNTALLSATQGDGFDSVRGEPRVWWRWVESAVGARLEGFSCQNWREANQEVDFVLERRGRLMALEVKSGRARETPSGLLKWRRDHPDSGISLVGSGGISLEEFFSSSVF